jgi:hypothetical protein
MVIILNMMAASTSEILVKFYQITWHNNPEDSYLQMLCPLHKASKQTTQ